MLNEHTVAQHLVKRGLLDPAGLLDPGTRIHRVSRRHQSFAVLDGTGSGFFVKQDGGAQGFGSVAHESTVYEMIHGSPRLAQLATRVPAVADHRTDGILVLRWLPGSTDLFSSFTDLDARQKGIAVDLGTLFGELHRSGAQGADTACMPRHPAPQGLDLPLPAADMIWSASPAGLALIRLLQKHAAFAVGMARVREAWTANAPVHFDVKLANLLIDSGSGDAGRTRLALIDWEYAGIGDPRWDIGSLFASFLDLWLATMQVRDLPGPQPLSFERVRQMLMGIWSSYAAAVGPTQGLSLELVLQFTAARLVHSAFELALERSALNQRTTALLQLALNIFRQPQRVVNDLMDGAGPAVAGAGR